MGADEMYRDLKSQGFHLEQTRLTHTERLDRLMLASALAYYWVLGRGIWVDRLAPTFGRPLQAPEMQLVYPRLALDSSFAHAG